MVVKLDEGLQSHDEVVLQYFQIHLAPFLWQLKFNSESDPSFLLSWLTAGTSLLELGSRIARFAV